ncbi:MAG: copper resistance protein CopC [Vicinamibacterales bacterium]|jgi:methionine-rich copper-binding protein CopC|nr:copper resistance protein CopC [Vicinamibacterales bacterium]|tara:strand:+ start:323 stop:682 length:360 start_codon:yes stop_codon:yes gene_type:complete
MWIFGIVVTALLTAPALFAHLAVTKTMPEADASVAPPSAVQVWFTQSPELSVSALSLKHDNMAVAIGDVTAGEDNSLVAEVGDTLASGSYTVEWRTAGDDGHVLRGEFAFQVSDAAADR